MKQYRIIVGFLIVFFLLSCEINPETASDTLEGTESEIYFRWTHDLSPNVCPTLRAQGFKDSNTMVPDNAVVNVYYGSCSEGVYQAQYDFVDVDSPNSSIRMTFSYTLVKPAKGYRRYYSKRVAGYHQPYNRCLNFALENNLVFFDEKL